MRMRAVLIGACLLVGLFPPSASAAPDECTNGDLKLVFRLNQQSYTADERVRMKMIVINKGPRCTMVWSDGQEATFYVFDDDRKIWDADYCYGFTQAIVTETWAHGHREVYSHRWGQWANGSGDEGCKRRDHKVGPGRYEAQGHFMGAGEPKTVRLAFRITA